MRMSQYFLPTMKENPAEAQIVSHRLMLRAGLVRQTSSGIYAWLPLGLKVLRNIERIVRGAERRRCPGSADADDPVGRPLARERPLRRLWSRDAAYQGSQRA